MEEVSTSETWFNFYETTWCYIPDNCHLKNECFPTKKKSVSIFKYHASVKLTVPSTILKTLHATITTGYKISLMTPRKCINADI
jgi:hypothetical protein